MYSAYYIFHIAGVAVWIGSFAAFGFLLRSLIKNNESLEKYTFVISRIRLWINGGVIPSALIVLITGVLMILQFNRENLPFYLIFMEQAGSLVILFTIIVVSVYSRILRKKLQGLPLKKEKTLESVGLMYTNYLFTSAALALLIIMVVGMRLT